VAYTHENVYYQKQKELLDEAIYAAWEYDLRRFIKTQNLQVHWHRLKNLFQQEFVEHVGEVIRELRHQASQLDHAVNKPQTQVLMIPLIHLIGF
jgi:hypothetical protein